MDQKYLVIFFTFIILFVSSVIYLAPDSAVAIDDILYMDIVSMIFFIIYLLLDYIIKNRYYTGIEEIIRENDENMADCLPEPRTGEQVLCNEIINRLSINQRLKIEELIQEKRDDQEFTATWVHEVKTPISVIRLLIDSSIGKSPEELLKSIEEEVDKIETLVEQAMYYSKIDDFSKDYFINEINVRRSVMEVVKRNARIFISKKIKIVFDEDDFYTLTDKKWLEFIIHQILSNSLKYTGEGGCINISFEKDRIESRIIILDNGIGIKPEDAGRVFEKGFTGYTGRQNTKSTGMGLYLAKKLAGKLGHDISLNSEPGRYTKVVIHFPKLNDYYNVTKM